MNIYKKEEFADGTTVVLEHVQEYPLAGISLYGKSTQVKTNGYQLLDASKIPSKTQNGITVTNNGDGSFSVHGKLTANEYYNSYTVPTEVAKEILKVGNITMKNSINGEIYFEVKILSSAGKLYLRNNATVNITQEILNASDLKIVYMFYCVEIKDIPLITFKPMLYQDGDGTWEPYTGGKPSPSPEYPQEIESVGDGGEISITTSSLNIMRSTKFYYSEGPTWSYIASILTINELLLFQVKPKQTITVVLEKELATNLVSVSIRDPEHGNENAKNVYVNGKNHVVMHMNDELKPTNRNVLYIAVKQNLTKEMIEKLKNMKVMILWGDWSDKEMPPYEEPQAQSLAIQTPTSLPGIPVSTGGNYTDETGQQWVCDEIDLERGKYVKRVNVEIFKGSEEEKWSLQSINQYGIANFVISAKKTIEKSTSKQLCNRFVEQNSLIANTKEIGFMTNDYNIFLRLDSKEVDTVSKLTEWLKKNNVTIMYRLKTPIKTDLPSEVISAFKSLHTYNPTTTIMNSENAYMKVKYYQAYIETKTDWQEGEFFNLEDYNRIKNNLHKIRSMAVELWPEFSLEDMGADKTYQDYGFYADEINRFESNVERIRANTFPFETGEPQTFYENQPFIDWKELNRIEEACRLMYVNMASGAAGRKQLSFAVIA